jgi:hypothetical protein
MPGVRAGMNGNHPTAEVGIPLPRTIILNQGPMRWIRG